MLERLLAAFLALAITLLALSGLDTLPSADATPTQEIGRTTKGPVGSLQAHHLDDLPFQTLQDASTPEPMPAAPVFRALSSASTAGWTAQRPDRAAKPPFLEGLLRPPCPRA